MDSEARWIDEISGLLKDISFQIRGGSQTAVIGPTAAGKTQLLYLLTSLSHPTTGLIEFDGHPLDDYKKEDFHRQVGFVFQDSILFNMSIRENIAFSDTVTDESLEKAIATTRRGQYTHVQYARFADDLVILID